jgi:hypothetical protein
MAGAYPAIPASSTSRSGTVGDVLTSADRDHFATYGYVRVPDAFAVEEAERMRDVVWRELAKQGIERDNPNTWLNESPAHLQHLKGHPAFKAVGSDRTLAAIDDLLGAGRWREPPDWGAYFLLFPTFRPWTVPWKAWHIDHDYAAPLAPLSGLKVHAMFGDVAPRAGGMAILTGSHRLVAQHFADHPPSPGAKGAQVRRSLMRSYEYLRDLGADGEAEKRIARFFDRAEEVAGIPLQVAELTATAGEVILMHPLLLHTRPTNAGSYPRFVLNKDLYLGGDAG